VKSLMLSTARAQSWLLTGRHEACELVMNDGTPSVRHLEPTQVPSGWAVADAGSSNGTRLHGQVLAPNEPHLGTEGVRVEAAQVVSVSSTPEGPWPRLERS
jgi:pSer/pThr/pTyr-binding forkhead associated (FHA) protein